MELAGAFRTMVAPRPWNGPLSPFTWNAVFTLPSTPVNAAAHGENTRHCPISVAPPLHGLLCSSGRCKNTCQGPQGGLRLYYNSYGTLARSVVSSSLLLTLKGVSGPGH